MFEENQLQKKAIGKVSPEERDQIQKLYNRKCGLLELSGTLEHLSRNELQENALYEKLIEDLGYTVNEYKNWWDRISRKYKWDNIPGYEWEINFSSCDISLKKQEPACNE